MSTAQASDTRSQSATSTASTATSVPPNFFGFTPDFGGADDATLSAYYKHIKEGGASWVRFGVYWWYIEKTKGTYTWHSTDRYFAASGLQWPGRSSHVHRLAAMGVGKTHHHCSAQAGISARSTRP